MPALKTWSLVAVACCALTGALHSHSRPTLQETSDAHSITTLERIAGWRDLLAEGLAGWQGTHQRSGGVRVGPGWSYSEGVLTLDAGGRGGDLISKELFGDFELQFEWRVKDGANSGVKVRVPPVSPGQEVIGPEYQVLDDAGHPDGRVEKTSAAALYGLVAPAGKPKALHGTFRQGRVVARGDHLEHWLDGVRVVDMDLSSPEFELAKGSSKFAEIEDFGRGTGHVVLQDHGDEVQFRRVLVRCDDRLPGRVSERGLGPDLSGWSRLGDADYTGDGSVITGQVTGGQQSFLHTDQVFGDLILDVDVKLDVAMNSGIQVRSTVNHESRSLSGYQIEIDPSERSWSGGLYDERRRGWLDDLSDDERARAAFDLDGWNSYHIECIGPSLRAWVNGVPAANHLDAMTLEGVVALQVHSGPAGRIRWRNLRLRDLGRHDWEPLLLSPSESSAGSLKEPEEGVAQMDWHSESAGIWSFPMRECVGDFSLRIRYAGDGLLALQSSRELQEAMPFPRIAEDSREALHLEEDGTWTVTPLRGEGGKSVQDEHVLEVHSYGGRVAVVLNGVTLADRLVNAGGSRGACALEARVSPGQSLEIRGVDRLVQQASRR
ncbi:MAG: DUF1080 domain-containing protein [Planctomycetota bacterium]|nr:DUF1080 domain-containing protein [Planctomycetota bacterium]